MLKIPCSYVAGLTNNNRFKNKWETIASLITRYNPKIMKYFLTSGEIQRIKNKNFYVDTRKAAIVKKCLRGEEVLIPARYRNQVAGIIREKLHNFKNAHEFITKQFENFSLYGQTDGFYKDHVLEFKTRMRYYYIPPHDLIQLGCYMIIKQSKGVLVQDLHGKFKEQFWTLEDMEIFMKPILEDLNKVVLQITKIFSGDITDSERSEIRRSLLRH